MVYLIIFLLFLIVVVLVEGKWHIFKNFGRGLGNSNAKKFGMNYTDKEKDDE